MSGLNVKTDMLTSLVVGVAGIAMIVLHNRLDVMSWIVMMIGVLFIIPGVFSVLTGALSRERKSGAAILAGVGAVLLGAMMCARPEFFAGIMVTIFGIILVMIGIYHICFVAWLARPFVLPFYYYIIPVLTIVAGLVVMFSSVRSFNSVVLLITGISFICSSVSSLMEWIATHPGHHRGDGMDYTRRTDNVAVIEK